MDGNVVVSAAWLADRLGEVTVVDVRDEWEYEGIGHVPGAVNVPFARFRSADSDEGMLPGADAWRELMASAGVGTDDTLVAYDDTHGVFAARFLVTALAYGGRDLHLLNGDFSAWTREHRTETGPVERERAAYEVRAPVEDPFVGYDEVRALLEDGTVERGEAVVLDTREPWEFAEGHLPGATQLDWRELVDEGSRGLRPEADLRATLSDHGVEPGTRVVLYCNTARRISHTYVVLRHLGFEDVGFYEGSLTEWEAEGGPLETAEEG